MTKQSVIQISPYTRKVLMFYAINLVEVEIQQFTIDDKWIITERRQVWKDEYEAIKEVWG